MGTKDKPKQFLMVYGKPIIVHTVEVFQKHNEIDAIIVSCIPESISYMFELKNEYHLDKIKAIVEGGKTGQLSIYKGLKKASELYGMEDNVVLIHDGVRPCISEKLITDNLRTVKKFGNSITCSKTTETFLVTDKLGDVSIVPERIQSRCAKAPQCFYLKDILEKHELALAEGNDNMIDSCTLMNHFGIKLAITECGSENIKITTADDYYIFKTFCDIKESQQLK